MSNLNTNPTFERIASCLAAYGDQDRAFWPFLPAVVDGDEAVNDPAAAAEAMRRMLAVTLSDIYARYCDGDRAEFLAESGIGAGGTLVR